MAEVLHPRLPAVEQGVLLGFVCSACLTFSRKYVAPCGCYACSFCHHHVPPIGYLAACKLTGWLVNNPSLS